jgi:uncharacterized membrane protein YhaH (DUF805 family)
MNWYLTVLKKYAVFNGRARRKEYWYFILFSIIVSVILSILDAILLSMGAPGVTSVLYSLAVILPSLGVMIRRLHDTGRSGWWVLINIIPIIGFIIFLVFAVQDSQPEANQYGENPKEDFEIS